MSPSKNQAEMRKAKKTATREIRLESATHKITIRQRREMRWNPQNRLFIIEIHVSGKKDAHHPKIEQKQLKCQMEN